MRNRLFHILLVAFVAIMGIAIFWYLATTAIESNDMALAILMGIIGTLIAFAFVLFLILAPGAK